MVGRLKWAAVQFHFSLAWSCIFLCLYAHKCRETIPHFGFSLANHNSNICISLWYLGKPKFLSMRPLWRGVISIVQMGSWDIKNMISKAYDDFQSTLWNTEGWCFSEYLELHIGCSVIPHWKRDGVCSCNQHYILMETFKSSHIFMDTLMFAFFSVRIYVVASLVICSQYSSTFTYQSN